MKLSLAPTETDECLAFIGWTRLVIYNGRPLFDRVVKIPNERGKRGAMTAILVGMGMRKGFPDYFIAAPAGRWHGLLLEAKRVSDSRTSDEQLQWQRDLNVWGYRSEICQGSHELIRSTKNYFQDAGCVSDGSWIDRTRISE